MQEHLSNIASQYNIVNDSVCLHLEVDDIEQLLSDLTDTMTKISKENVPISKFNPNLKSYWNMELTCLSRGQMTIMWEWRAAGWPRGYDSEVYRRYKDAKHTFQREKRRDKHEYERGYVQEVEDEGKIDIRAFWYAYNKMKRKIKKESKAN